MDNYKRGAPYRATRMWNEVVVAFRSGMPLRKHRRHMRSFENCFSASEAVDWLHNFLRRNHSFGPDVTRQQTVQLLQKFMKAGVFERVKSNSKDNQEEFKDNSQLYKFSYNTLSTKQSPLIALIRAPLSALNVNNYPKVDKPKKFNSVPFFSHGKFGMENNRVQLQNVECIPECYFVARALSIREIENTWKSVIISRLQDILKGKDIDELIDRKLIDGHVIMHNATRLSKTGVVTLTDKTDDLPHWVMSAMKCLTNWPNANGSSSCLPNYPGFEMDVFKVVKDYFTNMGIPLIPFNLYKLFMYIFETLYYQTEENKSLEKNKELSDNNSAATFSSFENLLTQNPVQSKVTTDSEQKTSTPLYLATELNNTQMPFESSSMKQSCNNSEKISDNNCAFNNYPEDFCFETAFITVSPVTRLVVNYSKEHGSQSSLHTLTSQATSGIETASTISACSHVYPHQRNFMIRTPSNQSFHTVRSANDLQDLTAANKLSYVNKEVQETPRCNSVDNLNRSLRYSAKRNQNLDTRTLCTLPRKLTTSIDGFSKSTETCGIKGYGSLRQLKYDHKFKKEEHARNVQNLSNCKHASGTECNGNPKAIDNQSDTTMNSYYTAHSSDDNSWNTCKNNTIREYSFNQNSYLQNNSLHQSPERLNRSKERDSVKDSSRSSSDFTDNDNIQKNDHFWKKPSLQLARKTILSSLKIPVYRPPTPISCSKRVNLKKSENESIKFVHDEILPPRPEPDGESSCNYKINEDHKHKVIAALQLCLLLLPSPNRRHLHLLLRMIYKILENNELNLYNHIMTRDFLLSTFTRCIICAENEIDYNEIQALALISFLLDECEIVFQISSALKDDIALKLTEMQRGRIKYTVDDSCSLAYCEQVSLPQYEEQKNILSQQALANLLENLISNPNMSDKEKRRKIKQFKENHLNIYLNRFPNEDAEAAFFAKKPKQNLLSRILSVRL
ncbi:DEP domain-containing protein 1A-like isoform X1 [Centruroides vittatus]|uniref:DEP domain-containing protein 1A-like isoform X1 n=1 Tax=Centruroides vittatus TaxID=120091 RepID=UPI00350FE0E9